jgi:hypothetical protein
MALKNFESNALLLVLEGMKGADLSKIKIGSDMIESLENNVCYFVNESGKSKYTIDPSEDDTDLAIARLRQEVLTLYNGLIQESTLGISKSLTLKDLETEETLLRIYGIVYDKCKTDLLKDSGAMKRVANLQTFFDSSIENHSRTTNDFALSSSMYRFFNSFIKVKDLNKQLIYAFLQSNRRNLKINTRVIDSINGDISEEFEDVDEEALNNMPLNDIISYLTTKYRNEQKLEVVADDDEYMERYL